MNINTTSLNSVRQTKTPTSVKSNQPVRFGGDSEDEFQNGTKPSSETALPMKQRIKAAAYISTGAAILAAGIGIWCPPFGLLISGGAAAAAGSVVMLAPDKTVQKWSSCLSGLNGKNSQNPYENSAEQV